MVIDIEKQKATSALIDNLLNMLPKPDHSVFTKRKEGLVEARIEYIIKCVVNLEPGLNHELVLLDENKNNISLLQKQLASLCRISSRIRLIKKACLIKWSQTFVGSRIQGFNGLPLTEKDLLLCFEVQKERSKLYKAAFSGRKNVSNIQMLRELTETLKNDLDFVTPMVYKITRLGVSYLSLKDKYELKRGLRSKGVLLNELRTRELEKYYKDPVSYVLPVKIK